MTDKRRLHIISASVLAALLFILMIPLKGNGRVVAAILLIPAAVFVSLLIKKRSILSINKHQVLLLTAVAALVYVMLYYLSGLGFGFYKNPYGLNFQNFLRFILPIAVIIVCTEIIRAVLMAQRDRWASVLCYLSCVVADMLICSTLPDVTSFNRFMDLVAGALLPALLSNLLYNYLARRYGMYPNIAMRLLLNLHLYLFSVRSGIADSLVSFFNLLFPILIYLFIDSLYEKKKRYALGNSSRARRIASRVITVVALVIMVAFVMLVSNHFRYGSLVIATESMTGELNKGDVVIFERYEEQRLEEGQIIVFEKNRSMIVHRIVEIETKNGEICYYTKGDVNEDRDLGYVTSTDIVGVVNHKLPFLGYPTLWMRSWFQR